VTAANRVPASPLARRTAAELGVDLATIEGSGPNGAVVLLDVRRAADVTAATSSRPGPADAISTDGEASTIDPMRALIAERMATSNREIPHYHLRRDVDLSALIAWLEAHNLDRPIAERLLPAAAYIRAVALAAARHPELNGWWIDGRFQPGTSVNVAMAVSLRRGGLVTPKIADADRRTVDDIMVALREIVAASRTGSLRGSWMTGATITVTNLGDNGADAVHGVISPPEVGLVGFGRVAERPWVVDGAVVPRPIVTVTLAADHRATDGAIGSRFLATIATLLERPEEL
jgi:pyruvate dehydrogenase E2 component (dihydrolipoamide acetyltransferase)